MAEEQNVPSTQLDPQGLLEHIKNLTENQNLLISQFNQLKQKSDDPFLAFRTPDPIKNLSPFSGNRRETQAWIQDTEKTIELFEKYENDPIYDQIIRAVKSKIVGEAKEVLIAAGNPNSWEEIKEILQNSYGDRRDLTSHIQSLFYIRQGSKSIVEYYNSIKAIDTSIKATASSIDEYKHSGRAINKLISLITLTRYIDGLSDQLSMHVRSYRPETLEEAYSITREYSNAAYRQKFDRKPHERPLHPQGKRPSQQAQPLTMPSNPQNFHNKHSNPNKSNSSGKFRNPKAALDDDVSMRTAKSRTEINNHDNALDEYQHSNSREKEHDTPPQLDSSVLDSDDDEYFVDELNFLVEEPPEVKT